MLEVFISLNSTRKHKPWFDHPENPGRVERILGVVKQISSLSIKSLEGRISLDEALRLASRVHDEYYLNKLADLSKKKGYLDEDTYIAQDSFELALETFYYSYILASDAKGIRFLIARPPGHHAGRKGRTRGVSSNGFCLLNNAAAAVEGFMDSGLKRIAILDFDVHHGNGTMEIFYKEKILHIDLHQHPDTLYPYTGYPDELGEGEGFGYKANLVFFPGTSDDSYIDALKGVESILVKYAPEALVVSAGFDGFANDGLADLMLSEASYYNLGMLIKRLNTPTLILLEGGYSTGLHKGFKSFVEGLIASPVEYQPVPTSRNIKRLNDEINERVVEAVSRRLTP
ncbi:histone deacetylase family protein [Thermogladius sp. 4427co]|uniref:histone deacetylase family protein n=1 Tax=Thermogladius sp. 4427co TaxID=3450718 RepID=UPI003F78EBEC